MSDDNSEILDNPRARKRKGKTSSTRGHNIKRSKKFLSGPDLLSQSSKLMPSPIPNRRPLSSRLNKPVSLHTSTPMQVSSERSERELSIDASEALEDVTPQDRIPDVQSVSDFVLPNSDISSVSYKQYHSVSMCDKKDKKKRSKIHNRRKSACQEEYEDWVKLINKDHEEVDKHQLLLRD